MQALLLTETDADPKVMTVPRPIPGAGEALVKLSHAALNRRDVWIKRGQYPGIVHPIILGSDGCGTVVEAQGYEDRWLQERVVIYPGFEWGLEERFQSADYRILGLPDNGTFAEYIKVPIDNLRRAPGHLNDAQAAACPLAALTAWRALMTRAKARSGDRILVTGIGGGVAQFAALFASSLGADVIVTSGSADKISRFNACSDAVLYTDPDWSKQLKRMAPQGFDIIIDSAGGPGFGDLVRLLSPGGRIAFYGGTCGRWPEILPQHLFFRQAEILATTMGSPRDFDGMLIFLERRQVIPPVDSIFSLRDGAAAFNRLESGAQFGKVVLNLDGQEVTL
jgi:zinc-binding alcohol dehydrogenase/oxidoreductase